MNRTVLAVSLLGVVAIAVSAYRDFTMTGADAPSRVSASASPSIGEPAIRPLVINLQAGQLLGSGPQVSQEFAFQDPQLPEGAYVLVNASCRCKGAFPPSFEVTAEGAGRVGISFVANGDAAVHDEVLEATYAATPLGITSHVQLRCTGTVIPEYSIRWEEMAKSTGELQVVVTIRKLSGSDWASSYVLQGADVAIAESDRSVVAFEQYDELRIRAMVKDTSGIQRASKRTLAVHVDGTVAWTGEVTLVDARRIESDPPKVFIHAVDGQRAGRNARLTSAVPCRVISVESDSPEIQVFVQPAENSPEEFLATSLIIEYVPRLSGSQSPGLHVVNAKVQVRVSCRKDVVEIPVVVLDNRRSSEPPSPKSVSHNSTNARGVTTAAD